MKWKVMASSLVVYVVAFGLHDSRTRDNPHSHNHKHLAHTHTPHPHRKCLAVFSASYVIPNCYTISILASDTTLHNGRTSDNEEMKRDEARDRQHCRLHQRGIVVDSGGVVPYHSNVFARDIKHVVRVVGVSSFCGKLQVNRTYCVCLYGVNNMPCTQRTLSSTGQVIANLLENIVQTNERAMNILRRCYRPNSHPPTRQWLPHSISWQISVVHCDNSNRTDAVEAPTERAQKSFQRKNSFPFEQRNV